ncbi:GerMN domain-containing protein [Microbacteriaceae bacterium 4G12]
MRKGAFKWIICALMGSVLLAGCGLIGGEKTSNQIDPPKNVTVTDKKDSQNKTEAAKQDKKTEAAKRELYLVDKNGYVVPQTLNLPVAKENAVMKQALEYLVKDGPVTDLLPNGFQAVLPVNTTVLGVDVQKDGTAIADFSADFKNYKKEEERKIVEAVTWTLTQFENVKKVQFRMEGKELAVMPQNQTPLGKGVSRADGINFDDEQVSDIMNTKPVTLYFMAQNKKNTYYVPVTRRIANDKENEVAAVIKELVKGPTHRSSLVSDFNHDLKLLNEPKYENGKVTLNFNENIYGSTGKNIISDNVLHSLVLSLTEQKGVQSVAIEVNGKADILNEKGEKLTKPVTRPQNVNTGSF